MPAPDELCSYLWGPANPAGWQIEGDGDASWSPSWTRLTARRGHGAALTVQVASVASDGTLLSFSPWDREAGGKPMQGRLRDLAVAHRARFRRVLARGFETLALVEGHGQDIPEAEVLALAGACEIARVTSGVVVDSSRNIGSPEVMADRHHLREMYVDWTVPLQGQTLRADTDGVVTVRCRLLRAPFGRPPGGGEAVLDASSRVWLLHQAHASAQEGEGTDGRTEPSSPSTIARGQMVPLSEPGLYQASLDGRTCRNGDRYVLSLEAHDGAAGVRNATVSGTFEQS